MNGSGRVATAAVLLLLFSAIPATAQVVPQPTPRPIVTADNEMWYLNGEPITFSGNFYYPAGAQIPFNPNEMVRSGFFMGVPLYTRTTDEPFSVVYIPLARGFMQPYMRQRTGDVAGTAGTTTPGGTAAMLSTTEPGSPPLLMAQGPPTHVAGPPADAIGEPRGVIPSTAPPQTARPIGTIGAAIPQEPPPAATTGRPAPPRPTKTQIGPRPLGINAIFIDFRDRRWYSAGRAVPLDHDRMIQIGDHHGFPVFTDRNAPESRIYVATIMGGTLVAPYSRRR